MKKLMLLGLILLVVIIAGCTQQSEKPTGGTTIELTPQKVGETWWNSIFTGDWNTLFTSTVDKSNNSLSSDCQNKIKAAYASFAGATYSLKMENTTIPCTIVHSPLPIPSSECIAVNYALVTNTNFGNSTGPMFFVKIGNDWKVQIDCKWYSG
jgi:hypothetical protein